MLMGRGTRAQRIERQKEIQLAREKIELTLIRRENLIVLCVSVCVSVTENGTQWICV